MKPEERIAFDYLIASGHEGIVYEPDGNVPPDFSVGGVVAVEVRRLNENYFRDGTGKGLEQDQVPLRQSLASVLAEFTEHEEVESFLVAYRFKRPIGSLKSIKEHAERELTEFLRTTPVTPHEVQLSANISLTVLATNRKSRERFQIAIWSDWDSGGWVKQLYSQNIRDCIQEKTEKIRPYRKNYEKWWLLLIDAIGVSPEDNPTVDISKPFEWDRIVVVNPSAKDKSFEL